MDNSKRKFESSKKHSPVKMQRLPDTDANPGYVVVEIEEYKASVTDVDKTTRFSVEEKSPLVDDRCPKCGISYKSKASLKNHVQEPMLKNFFCP